MVIESKSPEFGPNGAVLNSGTITEELKRKYQREQIRERNHWLARPYTRILMSIGVLAPVIAMGARHAGVDTQYLLGILAMGMAAFAVALISKALRNDLS